MKKRADPYIVKRLKQADPAHVQAIKKRLLEAADYADSFAGPENSIPRWRECIEALDTNPGLLTRCNELLSSMVLQALNDLEGQGSDTPHVFG